MLSDLQQLTKFLRMNMGRSDFLFASPSFVTGAGRSLDVFASLEAYSYDYSQTPSEADNRALENDWQMVWRDLSAAIGKYRDSQAPK